MCVRAGLGCALLMAALAVAACGGSEDEEPKADTESSPSRIDYENPPMHARVKITPRGYEPRNVRILVGGTVTFVNVDKERGHTAETKDLSERVTDNNEFDTHTLTWEEPYTITFHKPEKVKYFDSFSDFSGTVSAVPKVDLSEFDGQ